MLFDSAALKSPVLLAVVHVAAPASSSNSSPVVQLSQTELIYSAASTSSISVFVGLFFFNLSSLPPSWKRKSMSRSCMFVTGEGNVFGQDQ